MMDIICITVCVNYDDILKYMLENNSKLLKEWYIVTSPEDTKTINLIQSSKYSNVHILLYTDFYKNGATFNFGGARRYAQEHIYNIYETCNILMLDADVHLPKDFLEKIPSNLEDNTLYGVSERVIYWTLDDYINKTNPHKHDYHLNRHILGFFQLYKKNTNYLYRDSRNCAVCDTDFEYLFRNRIFMGFSVDNLGQSGINWDGRKSQLFE